MGHVPKDAQAQEPAFASLTSSSASNAQLSDPITSREALLAAYKARHRELKEAKKRKEKQVLIENVRRRPPHLRLKQLTPHKSNHDTTNNRSAVADDKKLPVSEKRHYISKFLRRQFGRQDSNERAEGWAAERISKAIRRYQAIKLLASTQTPAHLRHQNKRLFDECCKCTPLANGPTMSESGIYRLAGPNLPKILRILRNKKNVDLDLLQPHGIAQYTAMHVSAQRGYTELARELLAHWNSHPLESPYQTYSLALLNRLLTLVLQLRKMKTLVSESNSELRDIISQIGVPFAHFSEALDRLHDRPITLEDILVICGHPLALSKDAAGNTPLHYAAEGGYLLLCELLIENGANINAQNAAGETPLHFAISSMHQDVCMYLVRKKADVNLARYVSLTLANGVMIRGTFVDAPDGHAVCKVMPVFRSNAFVESFIVQKTGKINKWLSPWRIRGGGRVADERATKTSGANAVVAPQPSPRSSSRLSDASSKVTSDLEELLPHTGNPIEDGLFTRVDTLGSTPLFRDRNPRDVIYFRTAPGNVLIKANILCVFLIGEHVPYYDAMKARERQHKGKLFHLLIQNLPQVAVVAMDSFRTPLFRCNVLKKVREYNQRWVADNKLRGRKERREALLVMMKGQRMVSPRRRRRQQLPPLVTMVSKGLRRTWKFLTKIRRLLSVQNVFAGADAVREYKDNIICEPKGILYEYAYDHAEFRGGLSPTLALIVETECKELLYHPWVSQLMDHKWNSFAKQTFRKEFHIYSVYFVSVFVATYLHVGDTLLGMPIGGYRSNSFTLHSNWVEYIRDAARIIYTSINAYYSYEEYHSYRERGSLKAYFKDGWNWFDLIQITCVWLLLGTEIKGMLDAGAVAADDFELVVFMDAYYNRTVWRKYRLRPTLMSIVGPQIFIKWIQFARGNRTLGPFVRMIFKMFKDISTFLVVFGVFLFGFAFALFILQLDGCKTYFAAVMTLFQISLGAWDWDVFVEGGPIAIVFFIAYAVMGTIMLLNLLIAMLGNTYDKIWEDRLLFFELERAKAILSIQTSLNDDAYDERYWCQRLYALEGDTPIEGIQFQKF